MCYRDHCYADGDDERSPIKILKEGSLLCGQTAGTHIEY
jgi:hypothetical protein